MNKLYSLLLVVILAACGNAEQEQKSTVQERKSSVKLVEHNLYDNKVMLKLPAKYERFNAQELAIVSEKQDESSFINQIFDPVRLQSRAKDNYSTYFFIDTSKYRDFIEFTRLDKHTIVSKEAASYIGGLFKENLEDLMPNAAIVGKSAKFGKSNNFSYGYYKFTSKTPELELHSNHYAFSSASNSYVVLNLSDSDTDLSELKNQIRFNE